MAIESQLIKWAPLGHGINTVLRMVRNPRPKVRIEWAVLILSLRASIRPKKEQVLDSSQPTTLPVTPQTHLLTIGSVHGNVKISCSPPMSWML